MQTIPAAATAELAAAFLQAALTIGIGAVCAYLFARYRKPWFGAFAIAWAVYALRLGAILTFLATEDRVWLYWHQAATGWTALAFLWAALSFSQQLQWRPGYWALLLFPPTWSYIAIYRLDNFLLAAGPAVLFLSAATAWTGLVLYRHHRKVGSLPAALMAAAFFLWSLHHLDYPFLRARGVWTPWGYYLDIVFELSIGAGILLLVLEDQHRGLGVLSAVSGDLQSGASEDEVLDALLARPLTLAAVQGAAMFSSASWRFLRGTGACEPWTGGEPEGASREAVERVLQSGRPEVVRGSASVREDGATPAYTAALPVFRGEEVRGVLLVVGSARDPFAALDTPFLVALGHQVGAALANADLYRRLEERTRDLERLAARMVEQHEDERRRLSRELHDETAQVFAAVKLQIAMAREAAAPDQEEVLDRALELIGSGIRSIRSVARDLRPSLLDDLGLVPALQALSVDFERKTGIRTRFRGPRELPALSDEAELALFRALQEGLSNVARHAGAGRVDVDLTAERGRLTLRVRDDGRGPGESRDSEERMGLVGMRERVAPLGGGVRMRAAEGGGTELEIRLPAAGGRA